MAMDKKAMRDIISELIITSLDTTDWSSELISTTENDIRESMLKITTGVVDHIVSALEVSMKTRMDLLETDYNAMIVAMTAAGVPLPTAFLAPIAVAGQANLASRISAKAMETTQVT